MKKIVFLDVDGVLNTTSDWTHMYTLNKRCVLEFIRFAKKEHAEVVLTSSWRIGFNSLGNDNNLKPVQNLVDILKKEGIQITGKTPDLGNRRAAEIERYLYYHPEITEYIIIDDDPKEFEKKIPGCYFVDPSTGFKFNRNIKMYRRN